MLTGALLLLSGCGDKEPVNTEVVEINSGSAATAVTVGEMMAPLTLNDQFEANKTIGETHKKVIFVFSKDMGSLVHDYLETQPDDYLSSRNMEVVADISRMPSLITEYVAMPGFKEYKYSMMLILDEAVGAPYKNEKEKDKAMVVSLDKLTVTGVKFVATPADLKAAID